MATPNLLERIQAPQTVKLHVTRGDSLFLPLTLKDKEAGGVRVALNGKVGAASVRKAIDAPILYSLTVVVDQTTTGATVGDITVSADGVDTGTFPEFGVWDLQISDGSNDGVFRKTIIQGPLVFIRDVTPGL